MIVGTVLAVMALLALPGTEGAQGTTGTVTGEVVQRSGEAANSAIVRVHGLDGVGALTDGFGRFVISEVPAGPRIVTVDWIGHDSDVAFVQVEPEGSSAVSLLLVASGVPLAGEGPPLPDDERLSVATGMVAKVLSDPDLLRHLASQWPDLSDGDTVRVWVPWLEEGAFTDFTAGVLFHVSADCPECAKGIQPTLHGDEAYVAAFRHIRLGLEAIGMRGLRFCATVLEKNSRSRTGNCLTTEGIEGTQLTYWEKSSSEWTRIPCLPKSDLACSR